MTSGGRCGPAAGLRNNQQIGLCEERGWHPFGMMGDRSEYQGVNQVIQWELWNITYKIFCLHIICLLLLGSKKQQTNKPLAKSSDGEKFPYCFQNWLSDEKKELKQHILGVTTRNPPRIPSVNKCTSFSAPEKEIHVSTGFWHLNMTWLLHRTAVHAFFSEHDAISVSLLHKILHNLPQTHGAPVVRYFFCK